MTERLAYTVKEAAATLGVSEWMIREEINQKRLSSARMGSRLLIPRWALEERLGISPGDGAAPNDSIATAIADSASNKTQTAL